MVEPSPLERARSMRPFVVGDSFESPPFFSADAPRVLGLGLGFDAASSISFVGEDSALVSFLRFSSEFVLSNSLCLSPRFSFAVFVFYVIDFININNAA